MISDKDKGDEGAFGGVFGNAFGNVFSDDTTTKPIDEENPKKTKGKKVVKTEPTVKVIRTSSRTFTPLTKEVSNKKSDKKEEDNVWFESASKFYEKKKENHDTKQETVHHVNEKHSVVNTQETKTEVKKYSPVLFKSKIITKEEKIKLLKKEEEAKIEEKKKIEERGIAFAKTFTKTAKTFTPPARVSTYKGRNPLPFNKDNVPYYKRPRVKKVKQAATLRTRVSGKSNLLVKKVQKLEGKDIRPKNPVVIIMGHVDHGKSTLLDYIRKSNIADREVGGITQKMSAYEIIHNDKKITFLDTPGHESFTTMRDRGAKSADIAILIVSAEDGVKPQTLDALKSIQDADIPFFIGVSKIDKVGADIEKTKQSLAENSIFVEGYGGDISFIPFSGKTGEGVNDLIDMILLMAEVADIQASYDTPAECIIIESGRDKVRGINATMIVKNGTLKVGSFIVLNGEISPVRIVENFEGKTQKSFEPGQPLKMFGWTTSPKVGDICIMCKDKESAELLALHQKEIMTLENEMNNEKTEEKIINKIPQNIRVLYGLDADHTWTLPVVLKTDSTGTLDAVKQEINKIKIDNVDIRIIRAETGDINENDIKLAQGSSDSVILGYNTKVDNVAKNLAAQLKLKVETFNIIYKLSEWIENEAKSKAPKVTEETAHGTLRVLKIFNANKTKQVLGGKVETGHINLGDKIKIMRRDNEIGRGEIVELQHARSQVKSVEEGIECGLMIESKIEIVTGDVIMGFSIVEK